MSGFDVGAAPDIGAMEDEGVAVELVDLEGNDVEATIWMVGSYSNRYVKVTQGQQTARLKRGRNQKLDGAQITKDLRNVVASCVLRWDGFTDAGDPLECNRANAIVVFEKAPHFQEQCAAAMEDHAAFFKKS